MLPENDFKRTNVLKMLQESLSRTGAETKLIAKGEQGSPYEILAASHEGIPGYPLTGQYFFPIREAAENVCYFSALMTILQEIPPEKEKELSKKVAETNPNLPLGMFVIYPEAGLLYKLTIPVSEYLSENDLFDTVDITAAHAIAIAAAFASEVLS